MPNFSDLVDAYKKIPSGLFFLWLFYWHLLYLCLLIGLIYLVFLSFELIIEYGLGLHFF